MKILIFWKDDCPNCPPAKELGKKLSDESNEVIYYNTQDPDGLTESILYDVMSTPSILLCDDEGKEIDGWRGDVPSYDQVAGSIKN